MTTMTIYEPADVARAVTIEARGYRIDEAIIAEAVRKMGVLVVDPASTVVLDPDNPDDVEKFSAAAVNHDGGDPAEDALRSLLPSPTPPEPNGLGAVVEASHSEIAGYGVFDGESWCFRYGAGADHSLPPGSLDIVTVVQHGVGCSCGAPDCPGGAS